MLLALILRVVAVLTREAIQLDETVYVRMAESLAAGDGPRDITGTVGTNFLPTFPFFIAGIAAIIQDYVISGYVVAVAFGVLLLIPVYLLGKELSGARIGLIAAALVAVNPFLVDHSSRIYSESIFMFFIILAILFSRHMVRGCRVPCSILAGSALGFAYLVNPFALVYLFLFILVALATALRRGVWGHMLRAVAIFLACFTIYAAPLVLYLHSETGEWTYSGKNPGVVYSAAESLRFGTVGWDQRFLQLNAENDDVIINEIDEYYPGPVRVLVEDPQRTAETFVRQARIFYNEKLDQVFPRILLPLVALGLFAVGWNRKQAAEVGFILLMISPALLLFVVDSVPRYFLPYTVLPMIWAAMGWRQLETWGGETVGMLFEGERRERLRAWVPVLVALAVTLPLVASGSHRLATADYPVDRREAGEWIKREYGGDSRMMSRDFATSFYADGETAALPYDDYDKVSQYARAQEVDFLVITRNEIEERRPTLSDLLAGEAQHPEWELLETFGDEGSEILVYRFRG